MSGLAAASLTNEKATQGDMSTFDEELQAAFDRGLNAGHGSRYKRQEKLLEVVGELEDARAKLKRFEEREPLVQRLIASVLRTAQPVADEEYAEVVRDFKVTP